MSKKIPEGWEEYAPLGKRIAGTRFIAFKVPLSARFDNIPNSERFTPQHLFQKLNEEGYKLGLLIDLTNTQRYYDKQEIEEEGVAYVKVNTEGKVVPSVAVRRRFSVEVDKFTEENAENDDLVGVHCTHGLNRSGYLICRYMIDRMGFEANAAITAFNEARGYMIERVNYLADLKGEPYQDLEIKDGWRRERMQHARHRQNEEYHQAGGHDGRRSSSRWDEFHDDVQCDAFNDGQFAVHWSSYNKRFQETNQHGQYQRSYQEPYHYNHQQSFQGFQGREQIPSHHQQNYYNGGPMWRSTYGGNDHGYHEGDMRNGASQRGNYRRQSGGYENAYHGDMRNGASHRDDYRRQKDNRTQRDNRTSGYYNGARSRYH